MAERRDDDSGRVLVGFMGARVLVVGAGVTGRSIVEALLPRGAQVSLTVTNSGTEWMSTMDDLRDRGVELLSGLSEPPADVDLVVTSPGVRPQDPLLVAAAEAGLEIIGDVELAWRVSREQEQPPVWLAVTGTNGKTTTVGMVESMLQAAGVRARACGNVGLPVLEAIEQGYEALVVELSSFQLHWSCLPPQWTSGMDEEPDESLAPEIAAVLNLAPDHVDWHGSMAAYAEAKSRIYRGCRVAVLNADDAVAARLAESAPPEAQRVGFTLGVPEPGQLGFHEGQFLDHAFTEPESNPSLGSPQVQPAGPSVLATVDDLTVPAGPHNLANALAAAALARAYGAGAAAIAAGLRAYQPGDHRGVLVADFNGVRYVNDSKATNAHATAASLQAYDRVIWLAGGLLKGADVTELVSNHAERLAGVVLIGTEQEPFAAALVEHAPDVPVRRIANTQESGMLEAVRAASILASAVRGPSTVLLAPAAASMDMFTNYAHRGRAFAEAVRTVQGDGPPQRSSAAHPAPHSAADSPGTSAADSSRA